MNIFIGADHRGYAMKEGLVSWMKEQGFTVEDVGATDFTEGDDYPDYATLVAQKVAEDTENNRGILLCGSGVGMAVAANKLAGIRAANIESVDVAKSARNDDDINVLSLGADTISLDDAQAITATFLQTPFAQSERHVRRIEKIKRLES
ncbi:MAG TPA: RpiB/LacA/LacB family sugar-phosphate isomerase [Candidatus Andersenbacteria bacterium]|nr:RpiB/LacA/LacB family sugar-phosphate isomerase [Candidatus Andersenbacteria bacterium]